MGGTTVEVAEAPRSAWVMFQKSMIEMYADDYVCNALSVFTSVNDFQFT